MADSYISDGSDIDLDIDTSDNESNYITADSDTDNDPLDNAQQNNDLDENRLFHDFMFDDSDDDEEFVGFQNEWKTQMTFDLDIDQHTHSSLDAPQHSLLKHQLNYILVYSGMMNAFNILWMKQIGMPINKGS